MKRLEARVKGRVQGVSFRYYTQQKAISLQLVGWVRNEANGDVTLVAEGTEEALYRLLSFLNEGPTYARVDSVEAEWGESTDEFQRFRIAL